MPHAGTVFEKVWAGDVPSWPIFRSDTHDIMVILDIYPAHPGHLLVIPREPVDHIFELDTQRHLQLFAVAKIAAEHLQAVLGSQRIKYVASGYDIPHVHLHLLPSYARGDVEEAFEARTKVPATKAELDSMQQRLQFPADLVARAERQLGMLATDNDVPRLPIAQAQVAAAMSPTLSISDGRVR